MLIDTMFEDMTSYIEKYVECENCCRLTRINKEQFYVPITVKKSATTDEYSRREDNLFRTMILLGFATTCIMLYYRNDIKDPYPNINDWDKFLYSLFSIFALFIYMLIIAVINSSKATLFMFVSLSGVVFAYMKCARNVSMQEFTILTIFWQTLLLMDAIVLFIIIIAELAKLTNNKQKCAINMKEKKAGATKSLKKYESMADYVFKYQCLNNLPDVVQGRNKRQSV